MTIRLLRKAVFPAAAWARNFSPRPTPNEMLTVANKPLMPIPQPEVMQVLEGLQLRTFVRSRLA